MASDLSELLSKLTLEKVPEEFLKWFWDGTNGNGLIRQLNKYAKDKGKEDRIRREKDSPVVYAIVVNNFEFARKPLEGDVFLVKVGFTHQSIKKGTNNRMEQLQKKIELKITGGSAFKINTSILFRVPIGCLDTTSYHDTEDRIREKVGTPVKKEKAKECNLPVHTEWVLTTQTHINHIKNLMENAEGDKIDVFKGMKAPTIPKEYEDWIEEEKSK